MSGTPARHGIYSCFAYVFEGSGRFADPEAKPSAAGSLILFSGEDQVAVSTPEEPVRFLLI